MNKVSKTVLRFWIFTIGKPIVNIWSRLTGKTNFTLSKALILVGTATGVYAAVTPHPQAFDAIMVFLCILCEAIFYLLFSVIERRIEGSSYELLPNEIHLIFVQILLWSVFFAFDVITELGADARFDMRIVTTLVNLLAFSTCCIVTPPAKTIWSAAKAKLQDALQSKLSLAPSPSA